MPTPSSRLRNKLTTENLWLYILSLLSTRDFYGYELRETVKAQFGFLPGKVTAYRVLYALKSEGFVAIEKKEEGTGRKRKYYTITKKGKKEIENGKNLLKETLASL